MAFDYFYGNESMQFAFYRIPKTLMLDPQFDHVSLDAKLLYGLLLDRTAMSMENNWFDDQGRAYIKEAQRLGMVIDVSHISDEAFWDIMDVTQAPVIATHSNSRAVCNHSRNLTDDMFAQICKTGGVAGFNLCDDFVGTSPDLDTCCDHFLHFMELDPDGKHIALGGDLDGVDVLPKGFTGIESYPDLADCLMTRGLSEDNLHDIFWKNALGVMKRCCI